MLVFYVMIYNHLRLAPNLYLELQYIFSEYLAELMKHIHTRFL